MPQHRSSPRISSQVPAEIPETRSDRYAFHTDGAVCTMNDAVSAVPSAERPDTPAATASNAAHPVMHRATRRESSPRRASQTARIPASSVADSDGASAVHSPDSAK